MNLRLQGFVLLVVVVGVSARSWTVDFQNLPKLDKAQSKSLHSDFYDGDGSGNYSDEEDYVYDDYDDEEEEGSGDYDDEDYDYDEDEEQEEEEEKGSKVDDVTGNLIPAPHLKAKEGAGIEDDWHFDEESKDRKEVHDGDLLYEYYNDLYEEDYELRDKENPEESTKRPTLDGGHDRTDGTTTEKVMNASNLLLLVASGLASFAICTLAFFVCCYKRKTSALGKRVQAMAPFYISSTFVQNPHKEQTVSVRCLAPPPSTSIVKNYHLVPQEAKEFISSSGMENSSHVLRGQGERPSKESEKLLLP